MGKSEASPSDLLPAVSGEGSHRERPLYGRPWFIGQVCVIGHGQGHPLWHNMTESIKNFMRAFLPALKARLPAHEGGDINGRR